MADEQSFDSSEVLHMAEAADRAGAIVTEHVRSIIDSAEARAAEIRRQAEEDAKRTREAAAEAAQNVLRRIDQMGAPLNDLVADLRSEAERLSAGVERRPSD